MRRRVGGGSEGVAGQEPLPGVAADEDRDRYGEQRLLGWREQVVAQPMVTPRRVFWRTETSRRPSVDSSHGPCKRLSSLVGGSNLTVPPLLGWPAAGRPAGWQEHTAGGVAVVDREVGQHRLSAVGEQLNRRVAQHVLRCHCPARGRDEGSASGLHRHRRSPLHRGGADGW